jgi:hypothetical protein
MLFKSIIYGASIMALFYVLYNKLYVPLLTEPFIQTTSTKYTTNSFTGQKTDLYGRKYDKQGNLQVPLCFPASATAILNDGTPSGKRVSMSDLKIGDEVLTIDSVGKAAYSPIFLWGHRTAAAEGEFCKLTTASGQSVMMTAGHYLYVSESSEAPITAATTVSAGLAKVGEYAWTVEGSTATASRIVAIEKVVDTGLYTPITLTGSIVVDGIYASSYAEEHIFAFQSMLEVAMDARRAAAIVPGILHTLLAPARQLYAAFGPEWATKVSSTYDVDGWKGATVAKVAASIVA